MNHAPKRRFYDDGDIGVSERNIKNNQIWNSNQVDNHRNNYPNQRVPKQAWTQNQNSHNSFKGQRSNYSRGDYNQNAIFENTFGADEQNYPQQNGYYPGQQKGI